MTARKRLDRQGPLPPGAADYRLVGWLFLRCLGAIYLAAFWSLATQMEALAGSEGIYPIAEQLDAMVERHGALRFLAYPSMFWLWSGDIALSVAAYGGCVLAALLILAGWVWERSERALLIGLYALYLSLYHAGQVFTNFQWDYLLLEAGFLAIFLPGGSRLVVWLFRWLLFRLRFLSGISKLTSGDPTWSGLTALTHYFETQPLPHAGAWYAHQLPEWLLRLGSGATLVVEVLVPLMMFLPRPWRFAAAWVTILWQLLILVTSNHNFFNLLTIALCLFLFDDRAIARVLPRRLRERAGASKVLPSRPRPAIARATLLAAAVIVPVSIANATTLVRGVEPPRWIRTATDWIGQYRIANRYHVFPTIKQERIELRIAASVDGETWRPYELPHLPADPARITPFIVPHHPRVDWMIWFVPTNPFFLDWFERFLSRLVGGSGPVAGLMEEPLFGERAPTRLRIDVYRARFSSPEERARTGDWWRREYLGPFYPLPFVRQVEGRPDRAPGEEAAASSRR